MALSSSCAGCACDAPSQRDHSCLLSRTPDAGLHLMRVPALLLDEELHNRDPLLYADTRVAQARAQKLPGCQGCREGQPNQMAHSCLGFM